MSMTHMGNIDCSAYSDAQLNMEGARGKTVDRGNPTP